MKAEMGDSDWVGGGKLDVCQCEFVCVCLRMWVYVCTGDLRLGIRRWQNDR